MGKIILGNMKSRMTYDEVIEYIDEIKDKIDYSKVVLFPSNIYINEFKKLNIKLGLQNIIEDDIITGEITFSQAKSMGIDYAIVGHSERRSKLYEDNVMINEKIKNIKNMGIVLCIGETQEEKTKLETEEVLKRQIYTALKDVDDMKNIIIAYEPIWAIGTGEIPSLYELKKAISTIKKFVREIKNTNVKVLYGGSVNKENIKELNDVDLIDGFLIGGACLKVQEFLEIIDIVKGN